MYVFTTIPKRPITELACDLDILSTTKHLQMYHMESMQILKKTVCSTIMRGLQNYMNMKLILFDLYYIQYNFYMQLHYLFVENEI